MGYKDTKKTINFQLKKTHPLEYFLLFIHFSSVHEYYHICLLSHLLIITLAHLLIIFVFLQKKRR
jgi:hypothetical protein